MESLKDRVAIIGAGCTEYRDHYDKNNEDLLVDACYEAFEDAGIDSGDIQAAWLGDGGLAAGHALGYALKLDMVPVTKVENWCATAGDVFRNACLAVASGVYDVVLAAGVSAAGNEQRPPAGVNAWYLGHPLALAGPAAGFFAPLAVRYAHDHGFSYDDLKRRLASLSIKNYRNGARNPRAFLRKEIDLDAYMNAPTIAWPLGLHDCCCEPHGAAAAIITRPELAKHFRDDYVLVKGMGMAVGNSAPALQGGAPWQGFAENRVASSRAYAMAGIREPLRELDVACLHDAFTIVELMACEDFAFAPPGQAGDYAMAGVFDLEGQLPTNPNGGLKAFGHGGPSSGLHKIYEMYKQLQGKCGPRQVENATLGMTHDQGGILHIYASVVTILGTRG